MRFLRLKLEQFAGVVSGQVEFGPGLNVLYGPNELGKSTLAEAARTALLMQHTSAAHEPWIRWNTDESPSVELVFQTGPQRFWRVRKTFGQGAKAKAILDESRDAVSFSIVAKGRGVDAEIRKLLKWGIPEPGGSGGPRGLPETFLTAVLLPHQDRSARVFELNLEEDYDDTGRKLVTEALQAMATDPMFTQVLTRAQSKVDEAFTSRGHRKKGKASPWRISNDEIQQAEKHLTDSRKALEESESVQQRITDLHSSLNEARAACEEAEVALTTQRSYFEERSKIEQKLNAAQANFDRVAKIHSEFADLKAKKIRLEREARDLARQLADAETAIDAARAKVDAAQQEVRSASKKETDAQRRIREQELENQLLECDAKLGQAKGIIEKATHVQDLTKNRTQLEQERDGLRKDFDASNRQLNKLKSEIAVLQSLLMWFERKETRLELKKAEKALADMESLRNENATKKMELDRLQADLASRRLPTDDQLVSMRQLSDDLRVAKAQLNVGITVEVSPQAPFLAEVTIDSEDGHQQQLSDSPVTFEARSVVQLRLGDLADVVVRGGKAGLHRDIEVLTKKWNELVQPALEAARVSGLDELEKARREVNDAANRVAELRRDISWNKEQIELKSGVSGGQKELALTLKRLDRELSEVDRDVMIQRAKVFEGQSPNQRRQSIQRQLDEARSELEQANHAVIGSQVRLDAIPASLASLQTELENAQAALPRPWAESLADAKSEVEQYKTRRQIAEDQLTALRQEGDTALSKAQAALDKATAELAAATDREKEIAKEKENSLKSLNTCDGELNVRKQQFDATDLTAARQLVEQTVATLESLPTPDEPVTQETLEAQEAEVKQLKESVHKIEVELHNEQGALKHVGGAAARERVSSFEEALSQKQKEEEELSLDYDAWRLLLETLRVAENDEAAHLGQAIMAPIAQRFSDLTQGRYAEMQLGPALETVGIIADGATREVGCLSIGTKEQLSTILRLSLAEQLQSVLLLDDQLAQSDPDRMEWFRKLIRETARTTQIIVLTCRPEDYLVPTEMVSGQQYVDSEDELIRASNLQLLISHDC